MIRIGVGVIGASPLRPGWAVTAHLPALLALSEYQLRAVATSSKASAKAAGEAYGVPAYADPAAMIARADIDLVVVTVKLPITMLSSRRGNRRGQDGHVRMAAWRRFRADGGSCQARRAQVLAR